MNTTSISLLKAVISGNSNTKTIREILGIKEWQFNEQIKKLLQDGFIIKNGNIIKLQDNIKSTLLRDISKKLDIERLLRGSNELVLAYLTEPITVNGIVKNTGLSSATVYRAISDFESIGAITKEPDTSNNQTPRTANKISIDKSKEQLMVFAQILKTEREKMYEHDAEIIYKDESRILKKVPKGKITEGESTAFSLFYDYGIDYRSPFDYYIKQEEPITIHDVIIHSVLVSHKDNDKMALLMSIVFYVKNKDKTDILELRRLASSFNIATIWLDIEGYLRHQGLKNSDLFLPWNEFLAKASLYEIDSTKYTLPKATPLLFDDINKHLTKELKVYLIGGENMRMKNLKAATKDFDIVIETTPDYKVLFDILVDKLGYAPTIHTEYSNESQRLHPDKILKHPDRSNIDLFTKRIMLDMSLSEKMIQSADFVDYGKLKVGLLRNEYVFLLKAVASREGDIQDMAILAQATTNQPQKYQHWIFDWEIVWDELLYQEDMNHLRDFTADVFQQISLLAEQTNVVAPFLEKLRRHVIDRLVKKLIRGGKMPLKRIVFLLTGADISAQMIRNRVDALGRKKIIQKQTIENEVYVVLTTPTLFREKDWEINYENMKIYLDWRFPLREYSTDRVINQFVSEVISLGYDLIGKLDEDIVKSINELFDYEKEKSPHKELKKVGAALACLEISNPALGNSRTTNFLNLQD